MTQKKEQSDRFKEAARKAGADESDDALDRAFVKLKVKTEPDDQARKEQAKGKKPQGQPGS